MKASAGHTKANTSLRNVSLPKPPQLRPVPRLSSELEVTLTKLSLTRVFKRTYLWGCLAILMLTTVLWSLLGARLQNNNADQLADSYLFQSLRTFQQAQFPAQHTFLLKWPLFWLQNLFHVNVTSFELLTIGLCLVTVGGLALILGRIERRPVMLGTLYLALAGVLLLVPAVPNPGTLLPTNMAMITTRNIEYILYIAALVLSVKAKRLFGILVFAAGLLLSLLFISDRLFVSMSLGGGLLMLAVYTLTRRYYLRAIAQRWLLATAFGIVGMVGGTLLLSHAHVTGFVDASGTSPYAPAHGLHGLALGVIYAVLGVLTNFGANPGHGVLTLREVPGAFRGELVSVSVLAYLLNLVLFAVALLAVGHAIRLSFVKVKISPYSKKPPIDIESKGLALAIMLLASSAAAIFAFAVTDHYYVVDSRYLTLTLFALFVCLAIYSRGRTWKSAYVLIVGIVLVLGILSGIYFAIHSYQAERDGLQTLQARNAAVVQVLQSHPENVLLGDYWRVQPIKLAARKPLTVLPLNGCTTPRTDLASRQWQVNLRTNSFAYLLTLDSTGHNFPNCTLQEITKAYGQPNGMTVVSGTTDQPQEVMLFYDHGVGRTSKPAGKTPFADDSSSSLTPVGLDRLIDVSCPTGQTVMQIVAHEDDDLLFMSPDLEHSIDAGDCVRTVYVTAGDAGSNKFYWLRREQGSEAAYAKLAGVPNVWLQQTVRIAPHEFATIASPSGYSNVTLIFLHLPDGNTDGQGFASSTDEGLAKLEANGIRTITSVDGQSTYTYQQLRDALSSLISAYSPDMVRTQLPHDASDTYHDHSDHMAAGRLATAAFQQYSLSHSMVPLTYYTGYPVHDQPENVSGQDLERKEQVFLAYSHFDNSTCQTTEQCSAGVYSVYLQRQYPTPSQP